MPSAASEFVAADAEVRQTVATMQAQAETELADPKLATPCRKVLVSLQEHWPGLTRFVDDPANPAGQQRLGAAGAGSGPGAEELLWLGCVVERPPGGGAVLSVRDLGAGEVEHPQVADVVPAELCRQRRPSPHGRHAVLALDHVPRKTP